MIRGLAPDDSGGAWLGLVEAGAVGLGPELGLVCWGDRVAVGLACPAAAVWHPATATIRTAIAATGNGLRRIRRGLRRRISTDHLTLSPAAPWLPQTG